MKDIDHTPLTFGKYAGLTPDEISEHDPSYIVWMYNTARPHKCSEWLKEVCEYDVRYDEGSDDDPDEIF